MGNGRKILKILSIMVLVLVVLFMVVVGVGSINETETEDKIIETTNQLKNDILLEDPIKTSTNYDLDVDPIKTSTNYDLDVDPIKTSTNYDLDVDQIKKSALSIPYDSLMHHADNVDVKYISRGTSLDVGPGGEYRCVNYDDNKDRYSWEPKGDFIECVEYDGSLVYYEGLLNSAHKPIGNTHVSNAYVLYILTADDTCASSDMIQVLYTPVTNEEMEWLDDYMNAYSTKCQQAEDNVRIWGTHIGFSDSNGKVIVPRIEAYIFERFTPDDVVNSPSIIQQHTISYDDIPAYVDVEIVKQGLKEAVQAWNSAGSVEFTLVESDGDVNIGWNRGGHGLTLGHYGAKVLDNGTRENHVIRVNLGGNDCSSDYQQFASNSLKHTISHELGHYLGLRHITDPTHLMYPGAFSPGDPPNIYDNRGFIIPKIDRPDISTVKGESIESKIKLLYPDLEKLESANQKIKNSGDSQQFIQQQLKDNASKYNIIADQITQLDIEIICQESRQ